MIADHSTYLAGQAHVARTVKCYAVWAGVVEWIHEWLRPTCPQGYAGSSPVSGTNPAYQPFFRAQAAHRPLVRRVVLPQYRQVYASGIFASFH